MLPWAQEAATSDAGGAFLSLFCRWLSLETDELLHHVTAPLAGFGGPSSQPGGSRVSLDTPLHREYVHFLRLLSINLTLTFLPRQTSPR